MSVLEVGHLSLTIHASRLQATLWFKLCFRNIMNWEINLLENHRHQTVIHHFHVNSRFYNKNALQNKHKAVSVQWKSFCQSLSLCVCIYIYIYIHIYIYIYIYMHYIHNGLCGRLCCPDISKWQEGWRQLDIWSIEEVNRECLRADQK